VETGVFPLYSIENGEFKLSVDYPELKPLREYTKLQGRFRHLSEDKLDQIQERVIKEYAKLKAKCI
jgi:pyruvate ferredoxin oxidoreductase beta subunit